MSFLVLKNVMPRWQIHSWGLCSHWPLFDTWIYTKVSQFCYRCLLRIESSLLPFYVMLFVNFLLWGMTFHQCALLVLFYLNVFHRPSWLNSLLWRLLEVYYLLTVLWSSASLWLSHASKKSLSPLLSFFRVFLFGLSPQRRRRVIGGRRMTGGIRKECVERERRGIDES